MAGGLDRRAVLAGLGAAALAPAALAQEARVLVVSRRRVLRETEAGKALLAAEEAQSAAFEARVEAAKSALETREAELARLRGTLPRAEFHRRTEAFDRAVRATRRATQRQAAEMQKAFRAGRDRLTKALAPILIEVLKERGADIILDSETILVARPGVDVTEEVIARFDESVPPREIDLGPQPPLLPEDFATPGEGAADGG